MHALDSILLYYICYIDKNDSNEDRRSANIQEVMSIYNLFNKKEISTTNTNEIISPRVSRTKFEFRLVFNLSHYFNQLLFFVF
jgi:hypothetical protein